MKIEYAENTLMTFIDILGFKNMVQNKSLIELHDLINEFIQMDNSGQYNAITNIKTRFISDSLIVWINFENAKDCSSYFVYLGSIVAKIHSIGNMFVRGCVAYGKHYNDQNAWISPVFISAYSGEQRACYPRIIMDESAISAIGKLYPDFLNSIWFNRDPDSVMYLNYMNMISGAYLPEGDHIVALMNHSELVQSLLRHKLVIEKAIKNSPQHLSKYLWLANQHNDYVENHVNLKGKNQLIISKKAQQVDAPERFAPGDP